MSLRKAALALLGIIYWLLFAYSHTMIVYYSQNVYPLLHATGEPNPVVFINTGSILAFYFSGMEWFPTGHFMFMLLIGDTSFSIIITVLLLFNVGLMEQYYRGRNQGRYKAIEYMLLAVTLISAISPLGVFITMAVNYIYTSTFLEFFTEDFTYITDPASALLLFVLLFAWKKLIFLNGTEKDAQ
jgi:hypothetical protein